MDGTAVQSGVLVGDTRRSRALLLGVIGVAVWITAGVLLEGGVPRGVGTQTGPGLFVVGLAARSGSDRANDLERLTDALRQFTSRLESVPPAQLSSIDEPLDVTIDRDDELGRLSETVTDLTSVVCDRERRRAESERYRQELYRITSDPNTTGETKIRRLLELGCERLDLETGFVSRFDESTERYEIETAVGHEADLEGTVMELSESPCDDLVESDEVRGNIDADPIEWADHPIADELGINCHLGGTIVVEGDYCGTICFLDREPREQPFTPAETSFVELIARWVSQTFERRTYVQRVRERERRLERAQAFTTDMLDAVTDVVYLLGEDGAVRQWNESLCEATGYTDAEIESMHALEFFDETDHDRIMDSIDEVLETGSTRIDVPIVTKDGEQRPYEFVASTLENPAGEQVIAGVGRNVGERLEKQRRLERYERFTTDVIDALDDVFYVVDEDGELQRWNETLVDVSGYSDAEIESMHALEFFDEDDQDAVRESITEAFETGETRVEAALQTKSGERIPYEFIASVLDDPSGRPVEVGIGRDISDRKAKERRLREREARLERTTHLLEQSQRLANVGAWELDLTDDPADVRWTDEVYRIFRLSPDQELDLDQVFDYIAPADRSRLSEVIDRAIEDGEPYDIENQIITADGDRRWIRSIGEPVRDDGEIVALRGGVQDITARKERERELQRTETIIQALDELVYTIDADGYFRFVNDALTPLTGYDPDDLIGEHVSTVMAAEDLETAQDLIRELLHANEPSQTFEMTFETADGEVFDAETHMALLPMADGEFTGTAGVIRDISERKERERRLETTSARLEALFENSPDMINVLDTEGTIVDVNRRLSDALGYTEAELLGAKIWEHDTLVDESEALSLLEEMAVGDRRKFEGRYRCRDGSTFPVEVHLICLDLENENRFLAISRDISDRKARERDLRETKRRLELALEGANTGVWEWDLDTDRVTWNETLERLVGLEPGAFGGTFDVFRERLHPDDVDRVEADVGQAIENDELFQTEFRLRHEDGSWIWVGARGRVVDDENRMVGINNDITRRKEHEFALESLHGVARDLLGTDSEDEVADMVVETAADILEAAGVAVYHLDSDVNRFEPIAYTDEFAHLCDGTASVAVGDTDAALWNVYVTGTGMVVDDPASFDQSRIFGPGVESGVIVPIGDHGVFAVASGGDSIDADTRRLIETLVATTEAAFDRLESEASLRERETELEERNRRLNRQISITELIRRIDQSLIGADSRADIEQTVPERLIEADDIAFAWIGQLDASGTRLEPRAWAGSGQEYLDDAPLAYDASAEPAARTARSETPTVVSNVVEGLQSEDWRRPALDRGFQSVISVPLSHAEYSYGVLTLYADEPDAFADLEQTVVTELGDGIANAINAVETREALHAERVLELTLRLEGEDELLSRIAAKTGASVDYAGLGTHSGDETLLFFETSGVSPDEVRAALDDLVSVTEFRLITETESGCRFEATVAGEVIASRLVRHGASPRSMHADAARTELTVDVPTGTDVREFVEMLREAYPTVELQARHHVERSMRTRSEHVTSLLDTLTDRQLEVLRTAYFAGFFEWPRESTGEEIAELLEVTQPTVNRHLRIGQQRLLTRLFEEGGPVLAD
ncbi:PAS domain S-box protein [Haloarchaeobius amylolyticus]|uniref:histidine kinase n=1 Tax=Haloarchaeobius amylolyticus TaxID=1198296 RepID=A0ABD6BKA4_9EURY